MNIGIDSMKVGIFAGTAITSLNKKPKMFHVEHYKSIKNER